MQGVVENCAQGSGVPVQLVTPDPIVERECVTECAPARGCRALTRGRQFWTNEQPGWYAQVVGLSEAQAVGVPVQVVAGPVHPEQPY